MIVVVAVIMAMAVMIRRLAFAVVGGHGLGGGQDQPAGLQPQQQPTAWPDPGLLNVPTLQRG